MWNKSFLWWVRSVCIKDIMIKCFFLKVDIGDLNGCIYDVFLFIIVRFKGINENLCVNL